MSKQEAKLIYDTMEETGDLYDLFIGMTGDWLKDKKKFIAQYEENQDMLQGGFDLSIDEF